MLILDWIDPYSHKDIHSLFWCFDDDEDEEDDDNDDGEH